MTTVLSGILIIDKPAGMSSHAVVAAVRRKLGTRKVGHAGTLDPDATGVLVLGVGAATRLLGHVILHDKAYDAVIRLGASSTTDDAAGEITWNETRMDIAEGDLEQAMVRYVGEIDQIPSSVSAIKVQGKRAYARVRDGEEVELAPRRVHVREFSLRSGSAGQLADGHHYLDLDVHVECSSGTYIRALARDVGRDLGIGGHLIHLRRTRVGVFPETEAVSLEALSAKSVQPLRNVIPRLMPTLAITPEVAHAARLGQKLPPLSLTEGVVALMDTDGEPVALVRTEDDQVRYVMVFAKESVGE